MEDNKQEQTNTENGTNLLDILQGNVGEVKEALKDLPAQDLQTLLEAELATAAPRKGVLAAIEGLLKPSDTTTDTTADTNKRTAKIIKAEIEAAEEGPTDIQNANLIHRLRDELEALGK